MLSLDMFWILLLKVDTKKAFSEVRVEWNFDPPFNKIALIVLKASAVAQLNLQVWSAESL